MGSGSLMNIVIAFFIILSIVTIIVIINIVIIFIIISVIILLFACVTGTIEQTHTEVISSVNVTNTSEKKMKYHLQLVDKVPGIIIMLSTSGQDIEGVFPQKKGHWGITINDKE
jgi:hypothetical protein